MRVSNNDTGTYTPKAAAPAPPRTYKTTTYSPYVSAPKRTPAPKPAPKVVAPAPRPAPRPAAPRYTTSAVSRVVSGKNIGSGPTGRIAPIAPPKPPPVKAPVKAPTATAPPFDPNDISSDSVYKQQMDAATKSLQDYITQMTGQSNNYNTEFTRNNLDVNDQEKLANTNMQDDYASRGMSQSGSALKAYSDLATEYDKRTAALAQGQAEFNSNAQTGLANFQSDQGIAGTKYKNDAIARRALKYNLA